ncbi:MAG: hypothetical protein M3332_00925 [Actinomycetota bacterium]|nr:hypothetical protein [Actinomycetota bacterium]
MASSWQQVRATRPPPVGVAPTPVVRLDGAELAPRDARLDAESGNGIAVRLDVEDMDEDPEDLEEALTALLRRLGRTCGGRPPARSGGGRR